MAMFKVGIIGCGGRGRRHAQGYRALPDVELVACADPVKDARQAFAEEYGVPGTHRYYKQMLEKEDLDFVSICTWPRFHKDMVIAAANRGVKGILCEKPMAPTWGDAKALYQACVEKDVVLTFSHQRRLEPAFVRVKELANDGTIGQLLRIEGACPNLFDWGTHWSDMFFSYNNQEPAEWVIGQIDVSEDRQAYGVTLESCAVSWIRWKNGVEGLLTTGGTAGQGAYNRLVGTDGIIEIGAPDAPPIRVLSTKSSAWKAADYDDVVPEGGEMTLPILDLIDGVTTGREPELSGRKALQAAELIFATYESSRRRAKITLPLDVDDSALLAMIKKGMIGSGVKD